MDKIDKVLKIQLTQEVIEINRGNISAAKIKSLLLLIREKFRYGSWIREFGDFIAHAERDRGKLKDELSKPITKFLENRSDAIRVKYPKSSDIWIKELNSFLKHYNLPINERFSDAFAIVLFCSLQGCSIKLKNGNKVYLGVQTISQDKINLTAMFARESNEQFAIKLFEARNVIGAPSTDPIKPWEQRDIAHLVVEFSSGIPDFWQECAIIEMSDTDVKQVIRPHIRYQNIVTKID